MRKLKKILLTVVFLMTGCASEVDSITDYGSATALNANYQYAGDYEAISLPLDMSGFTDLTENPNFYQISKIDSLNLVESKKGTAVLVYGYPDSQYCQLAIPLLNEVAKDEETNFFYIDVREDSITFKTEEQQNEIKNRMLSDYESQIPRNEDGSIHFELPFVVGIKDGEITKSHIALTDGFEITEESNQLSEEQSNELKTIYKEIVESIK